LQPTWGSAQHNNESKHVHARETRPTKFSTKFNIVGGLVNFLSVIDVGEISKKTFQNNLFKPSTRTKVFSSSVHTYLQA
jgi:hypothetical protein